MIIVVFHSFLIHFSISKLIVFFFIILIFTEDQSQSVEAGSGQAPPQVNQEQSQAVVKSKSYTVGKAIVEIMQSFFLLNTN